MREEIYADRMVPCVIYAAKSTEDLRGSLGTQLEDCRRQIASQAGRRDVVGEFTDEGKSAYKGNRGSGLADAKARAIRAAAEQGSAEIWVQHSDRLARGDGLNADHLAEIFFSMRRKEVRLRSVQDDSNLEDVIRVALVGERNTEDSRRKSEAVKAGKRRQFERGERLGSPLNDGFRRSRRVDEEGNEFSEITLDPVRAPVIERIFKLAMEVGDPSSARTLNAEGRLRRSGKFWDARSVQAIVTNPIYAGRIVWKRGTRDEEVRQARDLPSIVSPEAFDQVQAARKLRDRAHGSNRSPVGRPSTNYLLSRMARCGRCGGIAYGVTSTYRRKDGTRRRNYVCENVKASNGACDLPPISAEIVDGATIAHLDGFFLDFDKWIAGVASARTTQADDLREVVAATNRRIDKCEIRERRLGEDLMEALESSDASVERRLYERNSRELEDLLRRRQTLLAELEQAEEEPTDAMLDFYNDLARAVRGRLSRGSLVEVNAGIRDLFERFLLDVDDEGIRILPCLRPDASAWIWADATTDQATLVPAPESLAPGTSFEGLRSFPTLIPASDTQPPPVLSKTLPEGNLQNAQL